MNPTRTICAVGAPRWRKNAPQVRCVYPDYKEGVHSARMTTRYIERTSGAITLEVSP